MTFFIYVTTLVYKTGTNLGFDKRDNLSRCNLTRVGIIRKSSFSEKNFTIKIIYGHSERSDPRVTSYIDMYPETSSICFNGNNFT